MSLTATIAAEFDFAIPDGKKPRSGFALLACLAKKNGYSGNIINIKPLWDTLPPALKGRLNDAAKQFNKENPRAGGKRGTSNYNLFTKTVSAAHGEKLPEKVRENLHIVWKTVTKEEKALWKSCAKGKATADDMKQFITIKVKAKKPIIVAPVVFQKEADEDAETDGEDDDE